MDVPAVPEPAELQCPGTSTLVPAGGQVTALNAELEPEASCASVTTYIKSAGDNSERRREPSRNAMSATNSSVDRGYIGGEPCVPSRRPTRAVESCPPFAVVVASPFASPVAEEEGGEEAVPSPAIVAVVAPPAVDSEVTAAPVPGAALDDAPAPPLAPRVPEPNIVSVFCP